VPLRHHARRHAGPEHGRQDRGDRPEPRPHPFAHEPVEPRHPSGPAQRIDDVPVGAVEPHHEDPPRRQRPGGRCGGAGVPQADPPHLAGLQDQPFVPQPVGEGAADGVLDSGGPFPRHLGISGGSDRLVQRLARPADHPLRLIGGAEPPVQLEEAVVVDAVAQEEIRLDVAAVARAQRVALRPPRDGQGDGADRVERQAEKPRRNQVPPGRGPARLDEPEGGVEDGGPAVVLGDPFQATEQPDRRGERTQPGDDAPASIGSDPHAARRGGLPPLAPRGDLRSLRSRRTGRCSARR
jgi:hypothetical protein